MITLAPIQSQNYSHKREGSVHAPASIIAWDRRERMIIYHSNAMLMQCVNFNPLVCPCGLSDVKTVKNTLIYYGHLHRGMSWKQLLGGGVHCTVQFSLPPSERPCWDSAGDSEYFHTHTHLPASGDSGLLASSWGMVPVQGHRWTWCHTLWQWWYLVCTHRRAQWQGLGASNRSVYACSSIPSDSASIRSVYTAHSLEILSDRVYVGASDRHAAQSSVTGHGCK